MEFEVHMRVLMCLAADIGAKDERRAALSSKPGPQCTRNSTFIDAVEEKVEVAVYKEKGPPVSNLNGKEENNRFGPKDVISNEEPPNRATIAKPADALILLLLIAVPGSGKITQIIYCTYDESA
jgi:hypothetical protein